MADITLAGDDGSTIVLSDQAEATLVLDGGLQGPPGPQGPPGSAGGAGVFDVTSYGAVGNNIADDTLSIQAAINAAHALGGGVVSFPAHTYKISAALIIYAHITLQGAGQESSILNQTNTAADGIYGSDVASVVIADLAIAGPTTGTGTGIHFVRSAAANTPYIDFRSVISHLFGGDGIYLDTPIVSSLERVISAQNGGNGFTMSRGTSVSFTACFANANQHAGYSLNTVEYTTLTSCAADSNGIGYLLTACQGNSLVGCGAEVTTARDATWDGTAIKITGSYTTGIYNPWIYNNNATGIWVTGTSQNITIIGAHDNSPLGSATAFLKVDTGCNITVSDVHNVIANSIAPSTTTTLNDGAGNFSLPGTLTLAADPAAALQAATKQYVDTAAGSGTTKAFAIAMAAAL